MTRAQICLWYDTGALDAARFYAATFPNSSVGRTTRAPADNPSTPEGALLTVEFTVLGLPIMGLNGGPHFTPNEAFSFSVIAEDQAETDRYWHAIVDGGGQESRCGWCKDRWGISWQITPRVLMDMYDHPDPAARKRAFDAMMTMGKIDVATIEAALAGG